MAVMKILILLFTGIILFALRPAFCQTNYMATNKMIFPRVLGGGTRCPPIRNLTNSYPYIRIGGDGEFDEFLTFIRDMSNNKRIVECLPSEQDTNGNWGVPTGAMQLSVRFHQQQFITGQMVPAYIILRNLGMTNRTWVRNALPDNGYKFTLTNGTNILTWMRPQSVPQPLPKIGAYFDDTQTEGDPYTYDAVPQAEGLTIDYLNRFFDLSQPGMYSLQVEIPVPVANGEGTTNVVSGIATFEVVNSIAH
jgi:hypothetical protein